MSNIISRRLREARLEKGLSQKKLGIEAGIDEFSSSPRMNQYERGKHIPDISTIARIAKVLDVPTAYFFAEDDDLADWIKCFSRLSKAQRETVLKQLT